jgi:hypothetical protein
MHKSRGEEEIYIPSSTHNRIFEISKHSYKMEVVADLCSQFSGICKV